MKRMLSFTAVSIRCKPATCCVVAVQNLVISVVPVTQSFLGNKLLLLISARASTSRNKGVVLVEEVVCSLVTKRCLLFDEQESIFLLISFPVDGIRHGMRVTRCR